MCVGVYLSLRGTVRANNSTILITEIGETNTTISSTKNNGLQCVTDRMPCCRHAYRVGEWFFPDGNVVPVETSIIGLPIYRNRGRDDGTVNLNRQNNNVLSPTGQFCCVVPDATDTNRTLCAYIGELLV